jgi:transcriptional regulator with XRE-family HTH domain
MSESENANQQRRRSKGEAKWPKWLRKPILLKMTIDIGIWAYRLYRIFRTMSDWLDG